eukprot:4030326-Prymnesium_polylepis.1
MQLWMSVHCRPLYGGRGGVGAGSPGCKERSGNPDTGLATGVGRKVPTATQSSHFGNTLLPHT